MFLSPGHEVDVSLRFTQVPHDKKLTDEWTLGHSIKRCQLSIVGGYL